ncbi:MAG: pentapeptide repeat-containing protein [Calothrix sp. C42_A2020_038]|nr:pentapeptide repeat-containing protein [Calothrix sp. C42_A2020_038]
MSKIKQLQELFEHELGNIFDSRTKLSKASFELAIYLGWLNSSLTSTTVELSFLGLTEKGLKLYQNKIQKELDLVEWIEIAFPLAYLESFELLVQRNDWLRRKVSAMVSYQEMFKKYERLKAFLEISKTTNQWREETKEKIRLWQERINNTVKQLEAIELNQELVQETITNFQESLLGRALNNLLSIYLEQIKLDTHTISIITGWVAWETKKLIESLLLHKEENFVLSRLCIAATQAIKTNQKFYSIESYLVQQISIHNNASLNQKKWHVFNEFTIPDIYVPLKCQLLNSNGKERQHLQILDLETWVKEQLTNPLKNGRFMLIQSEPGLGKSIFCRMFANWVQQHLHPIWTPILIRFSDINTFDTKIENTLRAAIKEDFAQNNDDWLTDLNTRFLFILDGFDELSLESRNSGNLKKFLQQLGTYQEECQKNSNLGHRFLITGRQLALHGIEQFMPCNLERVKIIRMDNQLQQKWLRQWDNLVGYEVAQKFQGFLQGENCPKLIQKFAQEPLLLSLLAIIHRDGKFNAQMFAGISEFRAKILIYQTIFNFVLTKHYLEDFYYTTIKFGIDDWRRVLIEAGLCSIQSGRGLVSFKMIEQRLQGDVRIQKLLEKLSNHIQDNPLQNTLVVFYTQSAQLDEINEGYVEFFHRSFGDFLGALRLVESLRKWTQVNIYSRHKEFIINDEKLAEEIYDLLYYGGLTLEIAEYLINLLDYDHHRANLIKHLFQRLERFYIDWCNGKFINAYPKNLPQNKMSQIKTASSIGLREVDIYTGLNVMILLSALYRYAQTHDNLKDEIIFYPCGQNNSENFKTERLICIINYTNSINLYTFLDTLGFLLSNAKLNGANLSGANLIGVKLSDASLSGVNFSNANLSYADLSGTDLSATNLSNANLDHANLNHANLEDANLSNTNLSDANLSNANLSNAKLNYANLCDANLCNANLDGANLNHAKLIYADLRNANLYNARCYEVNFSGANLCGATLTNVRLKGSNLHNADLTRADLTNANLINVHNITVYQVKTANNWNKAEYSPDFSLIIFK